MKVEHLTSTPVVQLPTGATALDAARMMKHTRTGIVAVTEGGRLHGTVTERDIVTKTVAVGTDPKSATLDQIMTRPALCISEEHDAMEAVRVMVEEEVWQLVVADCEQRPIGRIAIGDLSKGSSSTGMMLTDAEVTKSVKL
jgi:CBS domain-containing protein